MSFIANLPAGTRAGVVAELQALIATHPALRDRETVSFPYQTRAYRCVRRP